METLPSLFRYSLQYCCSVNAYKFVYTTVILFNDYFIWYCDLTDINTTFLLILLLFILILLFIDGEVTISDRNAVAILNLSLEVFHLLFR